VVLGHKTLDFFRYRPSDTVIKFSCPVYPFPDHRTWEGRESSVGHVEGSRSDVG